MDKPPFELPGYELLETLGEGGMAVVWKARQRSLDRLVAIKILMPQWRQDADAMARFRKEALAAARLKHSGIIQVFDAGETVDAVYFVMEYVAGYTIGERIRKHGPLDEETALDITLGVAAALSYAWQSAQMIHCDIKPDNIMIDHDGTVKIADLGLARALGPTGTTGADEYIVGTPNYLSPEQARGEADLDCGTDVYALGATLYHMVTGRLPFGDTPGTMPLERQQTDFLLDPLDLSPNLSPVLGALIERMMVKDRQLRPATWRQVIGDVQEVREGYLPAGDLPPAGASTVLRSAWRTENPGRHRPPPHVPKKALLTISPAAQLHPAVARPTQPTSTRARHRRNWSVVIGQVVIIAALVVTGYAALYLYLNLSGKLSVYRELPPPKTGEIGKREGSAPKAPVTHPVVASVPQVSPAPTTTVVVATPPPEPVVAVTDVAPAETNAPPPPVVVPPPANVEAKVKPNGNHHSALYRRAARFYNYALDLHRAYADRTNLRVVQRVEAACRQATADFNACREAQTDKASVDQLVQQCYQVLADTRLTAKTANATGPAASALPPLPSMDLPDEAAAPDNLQPALAAAWKTKPAKRAAVQDEFRDLFSLCPPARAIGTQNLLLYDRIAYGMSAADAARLFGATSGAMQTLASPLFPAGHYFLHDVVITPVDGFNHLLLIVDHADRIVAVQLVTDQPTDGELRLPPTLFQAQGKCYDFIRVLSKPKTAWQIAYRVALVGKLARLDCELASDNSAAPLGLGAPRARSYLYLPQTLAAQMLERAEAP
ncbi:MAG: serine/threonine protein kinase [Verrucomicrobia bacterium]|nr:MAG: serine/threonine protein kinase [Verrucomicrobiota bacterium]